MVKNRQIISFWEERSVFCIELLHNEEQQLQCVLKVLKSAPVPWSNMLNPLLKFRLSTHPLAAEITTEYNLQAIKTIKLKYGWPADVNGQIMKLACRIVKLNLPEMNEDIQVLVKTDPKSSASINFYCAYQLACTGNLDVSIQFMDKLDDDKCTECLKEILSILLVILA